MTTHAIRPDAAGREPVAVPVPPTLYASAAERLLSPGTPNRSIAARRFVRDAADFDIDLTWQRAVLDDGVQRGRRDPVLSSRVRQVALPVASAGRTAVLFVSGPGAQDVCGNRERQALDRRIALQTACRDAAKIAGDRIALFQALPAVDESWAQAAYTDAGFTKVADLAYMRTALRSRDASAEVPACRADGKPWPDGIEVRPIRSLDGEDREMLGRALDLTYEDTLDCPGLRGMRATSDVIDSHQAAGAWQADLWWLVLRRAQPVGCVLLNRCPAENLVELVYIGLARTERGTGLGKHLLQAALRAASSTGLGELRCAVDERNLPAKALYSRLGMTQIATRTAYVLPAASAHSLI
ncbi:MAG: GNAT family N-acetyltransferase [Planctomycetota bacterium]